MQRQHQQQQKNASYNPSLTVYSAANDSSDNLTASGNGCWGGGDKAIASNDGGSHAPTNGISHASATAGSGSVGGMAEACNGHFEGAREGAHAKANGGQIRLRANAAGGGSMRVPGDEGARSSRGASPEPHQGASSRASSVSIEEEEEGGGGDYFSSSGGGIQVCILDNRLVGLKEPSGLHTHILLDMVVLLLFMWCYFMCYNLTCFLL